MCYVTLTVKHILLICDDFRQTCLKYYQTSNLKDLFKNTKPENFFFFLKKSNTIIKTHTFNPKPHIKDKTNLIFLVLNNPQKLICC